MAVSNHQGEAIRPGELYTQSEAMKRLGWGRHAMRMARNNGLKVVLQGGRAFVLADEILAYFKRTAV